MKMIFSQKNCDIHNQQPFCLQNENSPKVTNPFKNNCYRRIFKSNWNAVNDNCVEKHGSQLVSIMVKILINKI